MSQTITRLPSEILSKIFLEFDWSSFFSTRLTCKKFYGVTKSRHFWLDHIQKVKEIFGYVLPLESSCYTTQELEQWVTHRHRVLYIWSKHPTIRDQKFTISDVGSDDMPRSDFDFLPGGRWLLVRQSETFAFILDVESSSSAPKMKVLFDFRSVEAPDGEEPDWVPENLFSYWIDRSKSRLSFLLVATSFYYKTSRVFVTEVELSGDGPADATFISHSRATFRTNLSKDENLPFWLTKLNNADSDGPRSWEAILNDRYYVEFNFERSSMKVYNHNALVGNDSDPLLEQCPDALVIKDCKNIQEIRFIHDNILVAIGRNKVYVFEIHQSDISRNVPDVRRLHTVDMDGPTDIFSPIKWFPDASEIIFFKPRARVPWAHLRIPHDKSTPLQTNCNIDAPELIVSELQAGFFWSLIKQAGFGNGDFTLSGLQLVKHTWDLTTSQCGLSHLSISLPDYIQGNDVEAFSEEVGRVVLTKYKYKKRVAQLQLTLMEMDM